MSTARKVQSELSPRGSAEGRSVDVPPPRLAGASLQAYVEVALSRRPSIRAAALSVTDARLALKEIAADAPIVSATPWNAAHLSGNLGYSESSPAAHLEDLDHTRKGKARGSLSLDLLVYDFGRNAARARAQAESVISAELALSREGYTAFEEVATTLFALQRNEALRIVAETNVAVRAERLKRVEERLAVGEAKNLDVTRAKLELATATENLVAASNDVVTAGADLLAALGLDATEVALSSVRGPASAALEVFVAELPATTATAEALNAQAREEAPSLAIARARLRATSAQVDAAIADLKPTLSASVGLSWTDPLWVWNWGVSAVQSLFTGFRKTTAVERATVAMETAAADLDREELALAQVLEKAVAERDSAREAFAAAEVSVARAKENLEQVEASESVGEATRIDVADAQSELAEALGGRIRSFYRGQMAEATLYRLTGTNPVYAREQEGTVVK